MKVYTWTLSLQIVPQEKRQFSTLAVRTWEFYAHVANLEHLLDVWTEQATQLSLP